MLATEAGRIPGHGRPEQKRYGYRETYNNRILTRFFHSKGRSGNCVVYATLGLGLRDTGSAHDQTRQMSPVIRFHPCPAGCGKKDATGLSTAVGEIALISPVRPK